MFFRKLTELMDQQVELHQELLDTLNREAEMTASCDLGDLRENHALRDQTAMKIQELENSRIHLVSEFSEKNNLSCEMKISELMERADLEQKNLLENSRGSLLDLVNKIRGVARENAERSILRINCISEVQKVLHKAYKRQSLYNMNGVVNQPRGACLMERAI